MNNQYITLMAKAHEGRISVHTEIPVSAETDTYAVKIEVIPQPQEPQRLEQLVDHLYGALSDTPLLEVTRDSLPEQRDEI